MVSPMQRLIAERMSWAKQELPHYYLMVEVDMEEAMALRQQLNGEAQTKISVTDLVMKAAAVAAGAVPEINARWLGDSILLKNCFNVGVPFALDDGSLAPVVSSDAETEGLLTEADGEVNRGMVPVVRDVGEKSLGEIAQERVRLGELVRSGQISAEACCDASITLSNLGAYGVDIFLPVIDPEETSIIGIGLLAERPVVVNGELAVRPTVKLSMAADHRVVDGARSARFLEALKAALEQPQQLR